MARACTCVSVHTRTMLKTMCRTGVKTKREMKEMAIYVLFMSPCIAPKFAMTYAGHHINVAMLTITK